jgi:hypothetical protein
MRQDGRGLADGHVIPRSAEQSDSPQVVFTIEADCSLPLLINHLAASAERIGRICPASRRGDAQLLGWSYTKG